MDTCPSDGIGCVARQPPPQGGCITPPPDVESTSPKIAPLTTEYCPPSSLPQIDTEFNIPQYIGPQGPMTPISPVVTRLLRRNTDPARVGADTEQRPTVVSNPVLCPRAYEELFAERHYVQTQLGEYSTKSNHLIWQYAAVEAQLEDVQTSRQRRQLRKQLSLLTSRCNDVRAQHRALSLRLSEISLELQSRDTWGEVQEQRERQRRLPHQQPHQHIHSHHHSLDSAAHSVDTSSSCLTTSPSPATSFGLVTPSTPLNGASPDFVPRQVALLNCSHNGPEPPVKSPRLVAGAGLATVDEAMEDFTWDQGQECEYRDEKDSAWTKLGRKRRNSWDVSVTTPVARRLSLPNLQVFWAQ